MTLDELADFLHTITEAELTVRGFREAGLLDGNGNGKSSETTISTELKFAGVERGK